MTNVLEFEAHATVERQAREWLIRLDGDAPLSHAEAKGLGEWLEQHPSHREELTRLSNFWRKANILTELEVPLGRPIVKHGPLGWRKVPMGLIAAGTVLAVVLLVTWQSWHSDRWSNGVYETTIGQQKSVALPDGSSIELNTDSRAEVLFSSNLRMVRLSRGEALFTVAHDAKRPFEVFANQAMVRAVGTAFTVQVTGGDVNITVSKGAVDISEVGTGPIEGPGDRGKGPPASRAPTTLRAGQTTTLQAQPKRIDVLTLPELELKRRLAWQEGYLVFSGEPLSEVVAQVNRYSSDKLEIGDPRLSSITFGGRFKIGDLDAVIDVLHSNFGIRSARVNAHQIRLEFDSPR
jgi:transmembrane sensor